MSSPDFEEKLATVHFDWPIWCQIYFWHHLCIFLRGLIVCSREILFVRITLDGSSVLSISTPYTDPERWRCTLCGVIGPAGSGSNPKKWRSCDSVLQQYSSSIGTLHHESKSCDFWLFFFKTKTQKLYAISPGQTEYSLQIPPDMFLSAPRLIFISELVTSVQRSVICRKLLRPCDMVVYTCDRVAYAKLATVFVWKMQLWCKTFR